MTYNSNPSSPQFREGVDAFDNEICLDACPYEDGSESWFQWGEGWEHAEFLSRMEAKSAAEDVRLDARYA